MKRSAWVLAVGLFWAIGVVPTRAATPEECHALRDHGHRAEAQACFRSLTLTHDPYLRAEGDWGLEMYQEANDEFRVAVAQSDRNTHYRVRWGRLLHERFNNSEAADLFNEALERDPKNAEACLGLALVGADGFDGKAVTWAAKALELDPRLVEAHEVLASLALDDSNYQQAAQQADQALKLSSESVGAMAVHAAVEVLADRSPQNWLDKIHQVNPVSGEGFAVLAHHLVLNRRYQDGIAYYRKALDVDPRLWSARSQLGINLMRLANEDEARRQLEMCYENGYRDAGTVNSLRLLDSAKNYVTFKTDHAILKLHTKEADLLRPYFEQELNDSIAAYEKKYQMKLSRPVQVEVYPDHEDFAVRTMGLPGLGALGATFGDVIAMDSPSGRPPGSFHWASTLRHEMCHVFVITATNERVPRWFAEGLAVHEESEVSPEWGDHLTPDIVVALRDKKLLPVAQLDRGFVLPEYPAQVIVSYFQAGRICDYIKERWGDDKLLAMVHSYAQRKDTPAVIRENLGVAPEQFDRDFEQWLDKQVGTTVAHFDEWRKGLRHLAELAQSGSHDEVLKEGEEVRRLYPEYISGANAYQFMAEADLAKGNTQAAATVLTDYEKAGGRDPELLKKLASLEEKTGRAKDAAQTLERLNLIDPVDEDLHRRLGALSLDQKDCEGAVREYTSVVAMHPLDMASAQFNLAQAYFAAGQKNRAEEHLLASLEVAPGYRPAQKLLLQLEGK